MSAEDAQLEMVGQADMRTLCGDLITSFVLSDQMINQWYLCGTVNKRKKILKKWNHRFVVLAKDGTLSIYENH